MLAAGVSSRAATPTQGRRRASPHAYESSHIFSFPPTPRSARPNQPQVQRSLMRQRIPDPPPQRHISPLQSARVVHATASRPRGSSPVPIRRINDAPSHRAAKASMPPEAEQAKQAATPRQTTPATPRQAKPQLEPWLEPVAQFVASEGRDSVVGIVFGREAAKAARPAPSTRRPRVPRDGLDHISHTDHWDSGGTRVLHNRIWDLDRTMEPYTSTGRTSISRLSYGPRDDQRLVA